MPVQNPQGQSSFQTTSLDMDNKVEFLKGKIDIEVSRLFKRFLYLQEMLESDHDEAMYKLSQSLPEQYKDQVSLADYLPEHRRRGKRKEILDLGNGVIRELHQFVDFLQIK